jgi:hypothetical protein
MCEKPKSVVACESVPPRGSFAQKVFWVRLCRTLAVSLRLTVKTFVESAAR